jgi:hypothetical protein
MPYQAALISRENVWDYAEFWDSKGSSIQLEEGGPGACCIYLIKFYLMGWSTWL